QNAPPAVPARATACNSRITQNSRRHVLILSELLTILELSRGGARHLLLDRVRGKLDCRPYRGRGEGNPKRLIEAASLAFSNRSNFLTIRGRPLPSRACRVFNEFRAGSRPKSRDANASPSSGQAL